MRTRQTSASDLPEIRFRSGAPFASVVEHKDALTLVRRLILEANPGIAIRPPVAATLDVLSGGRSAARVFRMALHFGPDAEV